MYERNLPPLATGVNLRAKKASRLSDTRPQLLHPVLAPRRRVGCGRRQDRFRHARRGDLLDVSHHVSELYRSRSRSRERQVPFREDDLVRERVHSIAVGRRLHC